MASSTTKTDIHVKKMREKEIMTPMGGRCFGTSPERPQVDSYIVFRHLRETVPCRAPLDRSHNPGTSCARACVWTGSRRLEYYSINPPNPLSTASPRITTPSGRCLRITRRRPGCSATYGLARAQASSFNVPYPPSLPNDAVAHSDPMLRRSRIGSWSRCIGIVRAPCGP